MTNKELLEHAANATGKPWKWVESSKYNYNVPGMRHTDEVNDVVYWFPWNPLEDNNDLFKLACLLGVDIFPHENRAQDTRSIGIEAATRRRTVIRAINIKGKQ